MLGTCIITTQGSKIAWLYPCSLSQPTNLGVPQSEHAAKIRLSKCSGFALLTSAFSLPGLNGRPG